MKHYKRGSSAQILILHMRYAMQQTVLIYASEAFRLYSRPLDIARKIKTMVDANYNHENGSFHCIVGRSFAFYITYDLEHYIFFKMNGYYILVFRRG